MIRRSFVKQRVDVDGVQQNRRVFAEQPARRQTERPRRRRTPSAQSAFDSFRDLLEGGR